MKNQDQPKYVAYFRVSTEKQGVRGLGMQSQQDIVNEYVSRREGVIISSFVEVASGKRINREQLSLALKECKKQKATLIIAKLDRLSRNVHFVTGLQQERVEFIAVDFPGANRFVIAVMAAVNQYEVEQISERTKAALKKAKENGKVLGNPKIDELNKIKIKQSCNFSRQIENTINPFIQKGYNYSQIAQNLTNLKVPTAKGFKKWSAMQVKRAILNLKTHTPSRSMA